MGIPNRPADAVAWVRGGGQAPALTGRVRFWQLEGSVLVEAQITGLPADSQTGFFAFHIHRGKSCIGAGFPATGSHYDPEALPHPRHAGDLPPLLSRGGRAYLAVQTDRFRLSQVLGRTVVIHDGPDDFHSQPAGNAGNKIACGIISPR